MTAAEALSAVGAEAFEPLLGRLGEAGAVFSVRDHRGVVLWMSGGGASPHPAVGSRVIAGSHYRTPDGREFSASERPPDRARLTGRPAGPTVYSAELPDLDRKWFIMSSIPVSQVGETWSVVSVGYHLDASAGFSEVREAVARSLRQVGSDILEGPSGLTLDPTVRDASVAHLHVDLSALEFDLLEFLLRRQGEAISTDEISLAVWGHETFDQRNYVQAVISRLRRKLAAAGARDVIHSVRGYGYRIP